MGNSLQNKNPKIYVKFNMNGNLLLSIVIKIKEKCMKGYGL